MTLLSIDDAATRAEISRLTAAFVAAVVREERRKAREQKDREIRALRAAADAAAMNPLRSVLFR